MFTKRTIKETRKRSAFSAIVAVIIRSVNFGFNLKCGKQFKKISLSLSPFFAVVVVPGGQVKCEQFMEKITKQKLHQDNLQFVLGCNFPVGFPCHYVVLLHTFVDKNRSSFFFSKINHPLPCALMRMIINLKNKKSFRVFLIFNCFFRPLLNTIHHKRPTDSSFYHKKCEMFDKSQDLFQNPI